MPVKYVLDLDTMTPGLDGTVYGPGDIVFPEGQVLERYLIAFPNGKVNGGNKDVIILLATSTDPAPTAWRKRTAAGTL